MPYVNKETGELIPGDGRGALQSFFKNKSIPTRELKPGDLEALGVTELSPRPSDTMAHTYDLDKDTLQWVAISRSLEEQASLRAAWEAEMTEKIIAEGDRQVDALTGDPQRALRIMLGFVAKGAAINMKRGRGQAEPADEAAADQLAGILIQTEAIRTEQEAIIASLPGADPATFDPVNNVGWSNYVPPAPVEEPI